jgi:AcrR family transcriptional regulator
LKEAAVPTRPSIATRRRILKAASRVFADQGYEGASVRDIVARADVNQAAINYHFGSKEGLYRAVLEQALAALTNADSTAGCSGGTREAELHAFVSRQLRPLLGKDELSDYLRIFNWETVRPSPAFRKFVAQAAGPYLASATALVQRFLPARATQKQAALAALWLLGQCSIFVRNREQLAHRPLGFAVDEDFVNELAGMITEWAAAGLAASSA